jgi:hypothetical protein
VSDRGIVGRCLIFPAALPRVLYDGAGDLFLVVLGRRPGVSRPSNRKDNFLITRKDHVVGGTIRKNKMMHRFTPLVSPGLITYKFMRKGASSPGPGQRTTELTREVMMRWFDVSRCCGVAGRTRRENRRSDACCRGRSCLMPSVVLRGPWERPELTAVPHSKPGRGFPRRPHGQ